VRLWGEEGWEDLTGEATEGAEIAQRFESRLTGYLRKYKGENAMTKEEIKAEEKQGAEGSEQTDSAHRRSFIKTMVAGAVAAGAIGAVPLVARAQEKSGLTATAATQRFRICFNGKNPPVLEEIYRALEQAAGETGCTRCGLIGYDIYLGCGDIIQPSADPYVITGEQVAGF
jgi:hypothetical protein